MDYRDELAKRLQKAPWSARQIALEAGVSPTWVAKAKKKTAHKITLETAQAIHAAIDRLGRMAMPETPEKITHRGVEELAADPALVERLGLTMAAVEAARHFVALGSDGQPVEIDNLTDAVEIVRVLQRSLQRRGEGDG